MTETTEFFIAIPENTQRVEVEQYELYFYVWLPDALEPTCVFCDVPAARREQKDGYPVPESERSRSRRIDLARRWFEQRVVPHGCEVLWF